MAHPNSVPQLKYVLMFTLMLIAAAGWAKPVDFNQSWKFQRYGLQANGDTVPEPDKTVRTATFDDSTWRTLDLPHDWGVENDFRIDLPGDTGKLAWRGIGIYRKKFQLPAADKGKRVYLDFDGAMANAKIYCNGEFAGEWPYGYAAFRIDLTDFVRFGAENQVVVRLDTEKLDSRWYPGAGIYRNVRLDVREPLSIAQWGIQVTTPKVSEKSAAIRSEVTVENHTAHARKFQLQGTLLQDGKPVLALKPVDRKLVAGGRARLTLTGELSQPRLWSLESPELYQLRVQILEDGKTVDEQTVRFGIRSFRYAREGLFLNGKRVELKGVCMHHDLGALGTAINRHAVRRQLAILKEMGCNAIRTSHNPPAPELLEATDEMGMMVLVDFFDGWRNGKKNFDYSRAFDNWYARDIGAIVRHFRNHPSIFAWAIGNEVMEQRDPAMHRALVGATRIHDTTRAITNAYNNPNGGRDSNAALELDVFGVNYNFRKQSQYDQDERYRAMPTMGTETSSCVSSRGVYFPDGEKRKNFQISAYDVDHPGWGCTPDTQFRTNHRYPYLWGEFVWTGFDYLGEPTPFNSDGTNLLNFRNDPAKREALAKELALLEKTKTPSRSSYFGIVDLAGFPKDRYYSYRSHWRPDVPTAHLLPHWNWPDRVGKKVPVQLYTSGDQAELFLNGVSQGVRQQKPGEDFRMVWKDVIYAPGTLKAVVTRDGKPWCETTLSTTGPAARLILEPEQPRLDAADPLKFGFVKARIADRDGNTVPDAGHLIRFSVSGDGALLATDNGDATDLNGFRTPARRAFNGLALAIVKAARQGAVTLRAEADGLPPATVTIPVN